MAELRRNPITQKWIIYQTSDQLLKSITTQKAKEAGDGILFPNDPESCPFCPGSVLNRATMILSHAGGEIKFLHRLDESKQWDLLVQAAENPVFRIEDELMRHGRRLYDTMGCPGAHEIIITTPNHSQSFWNMSVPQIQKCLAVIKHRMVDLNRDLRLGHQYAYQVFGEKAGARHHHSTINLIASPFIPEKIQKELSGAHEWYKIKERCLFCDIYEEERINRDRRKPHGLLDETASFTSFVPFFAGHPFEVWIQPVAHVSDFTQIPDSQHSELAQCIQSVFVRLRQSLGPFAYIMTFMNRPNIRWGANRGYWDAIELDWHWRIRILPEFEIIDSHLKSFFLATGSRINPILPEHAAEYLRSN
jgi:UDPglucose--hexose-1-phosphate uridylyltransferase